MPTDPIIGLKLLWGRREPATRGPKPGLDLERVVAAGIAIADAEGLEGLSMRRVAERLGVGTMTLYRYVPAKQELLDLMFDTVVGEEPGDDRSRTWRERLEFFARCNLETFRRHPWMLELPARRPPLGPNVFGGFDAMLQALDGTALNGNERVGAATLVGNYVAGASRAVVESSVLERRTGMSDETWWEERSALWDEFFSPERFPAITAAYADDGYSEPLEDFEFGLQLVLDGIEALIARAAERPGS